MKIIVTLLFLLISGDALGGELRHTWKSPSFSGIGASAHYLTIENQEFTRKAEIKSKKKSEKSEPLASPGFGIKQGLVKGGGGGSMSVSWREDFGSKYAARARLSSGGVTWPSERFGKQRKTTKTRVTFAYSE